MITEEKSQGQPRPALTDTQLIRAGEEITVDYDRTEGPDAARVKCYCQARNCRGYLLRAEKAS